MPMKMPLADVQRLAVRLHNRGASVLGTDSSASKSDMLLSSRVILALLHKLNEAGLLAGPRAHDWGGPLIMPEQTTIMTTREASILAHNLVRQTAGNRSLAVRIASLERDCRIAGRLILAMLRQVHSSDIFQLPPEGDR
jgi:hypothetical protein